MTHAYMARLIKAYQSGVIERGRVTNTEIRHDNWCGTYAGQDCNCNPEVIATMSEGRYRILADGRAERIAD